MNKTICTIISSYQTIYAMYIYIFKCFINTQYIRLIREIFNEKVNDIQLGIKNKINEIS